MFQINIKIDVSNGRRFDVEWKRHKLYADLIQRLFVCKNDVKLNSKNYVDLSINFASKSSQFTMKIDAVSNY